MAKTVDKPNLTKCPYCEKKPPHAKDLKLTGNHVGNGGTLGKNIMKQFYSSKGKSAKSHPLSIPSARRKLSLIKRTPKYLIAEAHHLICSETMASDGKWAKICAAFGYDINCYENGVFLPKDRRVACQTKKPLHFGNHSATKTAVTPNYVDAVKSLVSGIKEQALEGEICKKKKNIITALNNKSKTIWGHVSNFRWIITKDGLHYKSRSKIGCSNKSLLSDLDRDEDTGEILNSDNCKKNRKHNIDINIGDCFLER